MEYPYVISNNKIKPFLDVLVTAEKPDKVTQKLFKILGFSSSNDRAILPLLKRLGFLREDGIPTDYYNDLKDNTKRFKVLGDRIKVLYSDLYALDTKIHEKPEDEIKGAISRVTGKDSTSVNRYYSTFKTLAGLADFEPVSQIPHPPPVEKDESKDEIVDPPKTNNVNPDFHYNIQIHLPATTDISVYNAIFKSLKENLKL